MLTHLHLLPPWRYEPKHVINQRDIQQIVSCFPAAMTPRDLVVRDLAGRHGAGIADVWFLGKKGP